jgi:hypothetical protein
VCSKPVLEYVCPGCGRAYNTLQAAHLIRPDGQFHCEDDDTVLQSGGRGDKSGAGEGARQERLRAMKALQVCSPTYPLQPHGWMGGRTVG